MAAEPSRVFMQPSVTHDLCGFPSTFAGISMNLI
jgi:hypothetical protein